MKFKVDKIEIEPSVYGDLSVEVKLTNIQVINLILNLIEEYGSDVLNTYLKEYDIKIKRKE